MELTANLPPGRRQHRTFSPYAFSSVSESSVQISSVLSSVQPHSTVGPVQSRKSPHLNGPATVGAVQTCTPCLCATRQFPDGVQFCVAAHCGWLGSGLELPFVQSRQSCASGNVPLPMAKMATLPFGARSTCGLWLKAGDDGFHTRGGTP